MTLTPAAKTLMVLMSVLAAVDTKEMDALAWISTNVERGPTDAVETRVAATLQDHTAVGVSKDIVATENIAMTSTNATHGILAAGMHLVQIQRALINADVILASKGTEFHALIMMNVKRAITVVTRMPNARTRGVLIPALATKVTEEMAKTANRLQQAVFYLVKNTLSC